MTFARPIELRAGPTPGDYFFLTAVCLISSLAVLFSQIDWRLKFAGAGICIVCFVAGRMQLHRQRGWRILIYRSGAINAGREDIPLQPATLGQGSFRSRLLVSLPLSIVGNRRRFFLVHASNNSGDDYRRLLVWLTHESAIKLVDHA